MSPPIGKTLLVELLTEELPPKALKYLGEVFGDLIFSGLVRAGLADLDPSRRHAIRTRRAAWPSRLPAYATRGRRARKKKN